MHANAASFWDATKSDHLIAFLFVWSSEIRAHLFRHVWLFPLHEKGESNWIQLSSIGFAIGRPRAHGPLYDASALLTLSLLDDAVIS